VHVVGEPFDAGGQVVVQPCVAVQGDGDDEAPQADDVGGVQGVEDPVEGLRPLDPGLPHRLDDRRPHVSTAGNQSAGLRLGPGEQTGDVGGVRRPVGVEADVPVDPERGRLAAERDVSAGEPRGDLLEQPDERLVQLAVLAERASAGQEVAEIRDAFVEDGKRPLRLLLAPVLRGDAPEAAVLMLDGAVLHGVPMHGRPPGDEIIASAVDTVLAT
jgi:hypothetical protein